MIRVRCSTCEKALAVKEELAGKTIACPGCKSKIRVTGAGPSASSVDPSEKRKSQSASPNPPPRPLAAEDRDDEEDVPRRRRRSEDLDGEPERPRSRPRKKGKSAPAISFRIDGFVIFLSLMFIAILALILLRSTAPILLPIACILAAVLGLMGDFWLASIGFREGWIHGVACFIMPFYGLLLRAKGARGVEQPLAVTLVFGPLCIIGVLMLEDARTNPNSSLAKKDGASFPPPEKAPEDPKPGTTLLRAHWTFDEGTGTAAKDSGPDGLEATLNGGGWTAGVRGKAVQLNGKSDHIRLSGSANLHIGDKSPFTIGAWIKTPRDSGVLLSFRPPQDKPYDMLSLLLNTGKLVVEIRHQGAVLHDTFAGTARIDDDRWHHVALTRQPDGQLSLFVDGKHDGKLTTGKAHTGKLITNNRVLGAEAFVYTKAESWRKSLNQEHFQGCIDDLFLYAGALSDGEIQKVMKAGPVP